MSVLLPRFLKACSDGDAALVREGLEAGISPDERNARGLTPLMLAASSGDHAEVVALLLQSGADPIAKAPSTAWTVLTYAAVNARERILDLLSAHPAGRFLARPDWRAVNACVETGCAVGLRRLAKLGAPLNHRDAAGRTALHRAVAASDAAMVALLLDVGARTDVPDAEARTPLHVAAAKGHPGIVQALLRAGADPRARTPSGETPADVARRRGKPQVIAALEARPS